MPGKLAEEARFDGVFVLRTNAKITPLQAVLRYRNLLKVENLFLRTKAVMRTRPIFHSSDAAIRGHVFCSFLALTMQKYLEDLLCRAGVIPEWKTLLRDLDRLQHVRIRHRDNDWLAHRCLQADTRSIPPRPHRAAAAHQADGAAKTCPTQTSAWERPVVPGVVPRRHEFRRKQRDLNRLQKSGVQVGFGTTVKPGKLEVLDIPRLGDGRPPDETRRQLHQLASWSSTFVTKREISPSDANSLGWSRSTACSISRAVLRPSQ
jgi:hypothetical protein